MYLGELARKLMLECCKAGALFKGNDSVQLRTENSFKTKHIEVERDNRGSYTICRTVLEEMGYQNVSDADCENVRYICECISRRSAHLVATNLACLIDRIGDPYVVVGIDGSVYRLHPHYHNLLTAKIKELARPECKFDLMLSEDGSGRGAALSKDHHFSTKEIFHRIDYKNPSRHDLLNVRYICEMVWKRSAHLISATLVCFVDRVGDPYLVVAIVKKFGHART
ncbi:hypothetical protein DOY81_001841 [Sarcophaga bullata]|nr:hypothetical protein DOY81_001841 [Sarcophaga bullata]